MHLEFQDRILEVTTIDVVSSHWTLGLLQSHVENITFSLIRGHDVKRREEMGIREHKGLGPCCGSRHVSLCEGERKELYEALGHVRAHDA